MPSGSSFLTPDSARGYLKYALQAECQRHLGGSLVEMQNLRLHPDLLSGLEFFFFFKIEVYFSLTSLNVFR